MGKTEKLNKQIMELERKIEIEEMKIEDARHRCDDKEISKAQFTKIKQNCTERARAFRGSIARKEKARLMIERKIKDKEEKKKEKLEERDRKMEQKLDKRKKNED